MWFFFGPNIIFGEDALNFLENITGKKCFIITDKNLEELGVLKKLTDKLEKLGREYTIFNEVKPAPHRDDVLLAKEQCISYAPDLLIAIGGGSVLDTAKALWALYEFPEMGIDDIHPFKNELYDLGKKSKLIAIPTTSGTGAETTFSAVISKFEDNVWKKFVHAHKGIIPTYAIVDPIFPSGMPPELTVNTGFDALVHALESKISQWRNEYSDGIGLKAIELIFKYLPIVYKDSKNMEARDYLHQAASMAGLDFGNSQVHNAHVMGHSWSSFFHTHHGKSVGIMLPYITQFNLTKTSKDTNSIDIYAKVAKQLGWAEWSDDNNKAAYIVIEKYKELQKECNFPSKLEDTGVSREDFEKNLDKLINLCFEDPSSVMGPVSLSGEDYRKLYIYAYEGKDVDF